MQDDLRFRFPDGTTGDSLRSIVADGYALKAEEPVETTVTFYDTFDWRLFDKSLVLSRTGDEWVVRRLPTGATLERLTVGSPPGFVWEIADSPLKQRIASIVGARRLLPVGEATYPNSRPTGSSTPTARPWRGCLAQRCGPVPSTSSGRRLTPEWPCLTPTSRCLQCAVIPGSSGAWPGNSEKPAWLPANGKRRSSGSWLRRASSRAPTRPSQTISSNPARAPTRPRRRFSAARWRSCGQTRRASRRIGMSNFCMITARRVRRTRSALSQITDVFPPETTKRYKEAFGLLGERSNRLRDLDVYLLSEPDYRAMLPDAMREHLAPLLNYLRAQRQQALQEVIDNLNSLPYAAMMEAWAAFLHEPVPDAPTTHQMRLSQSTRSHAAR